LEGDKQLEANLIKDLEKTGYPAELRAGNVFARSGWTVHYNVYYMDWDEKKGREIDLLAVNAVSSNKHDVWIRLHLPCAVKKSKDPWVIFTTEGAGEMVGLEEPGWGRLHLKLNEIDYHVLSADKMEKKSTIHRFRRFGHSYYVAFGGSQSKPDIFAALTSSVKAAEDDLRQIKQVMGEDEARLGQKVWHGRDLTLIEPIVILDGNLYEAYLDNTGKMVVNKENHIPVCFGYLSTEYKRTDFASEYIVEIVTIDGLADLISNKMKWLNSMKRTIVNNISKKDSGKT
jgi:hypothetical protein